MSEKKRAFQTKKKEYRNKLKSKANNWRDTSSRNDQRHDTPAPLITEEPNALEDVTKLPSNAYAVILTAITIATTLETTVPGTFQSILDQQYEANKIPKVIVPISIINMLVSNKNKIQSENRDIYY